MRVLPVLILVCALVVPTASASLLGGVLPGTTTATSASLIVGAQDGALGAVSGLVTTLGGTVTRTDATLGILKVTGPGALLSTLSASPLVAFVEDDKATALLGAQWNGAQWNGAQWNGAEWNGAQWNGAEWNGAQWNGMTGAPREPGLGFQWGLAAIHVGAAWTKTEGNGGATICVLDSGIDASHADISPNVWTGANGAHGWNFVADNANTFDDGGHGTHVAGIAAASIGNLWGVAGVGNERVMAVKVLDGSGHGVESDLASGIAWCALHGAKVALMALSVTDWGPALDRAVQFAAARDVLLVASAGNGGCSDCVAYPARDAHVLAVSASDITGQPASFASRGPQVALYAPGVNILSTFPGDRFVYGSGTSQAAAFVAGAAALARDRSPALSAAATRALLTGSAVGGHLDVGAAIASLG